MFFKLQTSMASTHPFEQRSSKLTHNEAKPREQSKLATAKCAVHFVRKIAKIDIKVENEANTEVVTVNPFT